MTSTRFLSDEQVRAIQADHGTPIYIYDQATLEASAQDALSFPNAFGLTARYAMKALPTAAILRLISDAGLHIDASSGYEAERALRAGIAPERIQITAQQLPENLQGLVERGVLFNACSLHQLRAYGEVFPGSEVSIRVNPGLGTGHNNRTNVGGPSSSFGIWHEHLDQVAAVQQEFDLHITGMHTHIGSGGDPVVWQKCARMTLDIAARLPEVTRLSLGGGFKVARVAGEVSANLHEIGETLLPDFRAFAEQHGRELHLEIEPGTFMVANAGAVIASVIDVVDTGDAGNRFLKVDSGLTEILRFSMYGAQHPIALVPRDPGDRPEQNYLIAGHCCESGDILTPEPGNPEGLAPRSLPEANIGDALLIGGSGAYCSSMPAKNYNSFPTAPELLLTKDGELTLIRRRQDPEDIAKDEVL